MKKLLKRLFLLVRDLCAPFARFEEVSVLCYHSISDNTQDTTVTAQTFDRQLEFLARCGYAFVSLDDIMAWLGDKKDLPRRAVAITFDDGYPDFETAALPVLKKYNAPAALFVIGDGREVPSDPLVTRGYHSRSHPNLEVLQGEVLAREVAAPFPARYFAYPGGHYSNEAIEAVKRAGYAAAFSIKPTLVSKKSDRYLMPRTVITKHTALWELRFACTKAADWYRALWRSIRYP